MTTHNRRKDDLVDNKHLVHPNAHKLPIEDQLLLRWCEADPVSPLCNETLIHLISKHPDVLSL